MSLKTKKKIRFSVQDQCTSFGDIRTHKVLPNEFVQVIGPFIFLKHILSRKQFFKDPHKEPAGKYSRPYRGISTLTYILAGEVEHLDSIGNHTKLSSGGIHWTKSGSGIIHDEIISSEVQLTEQDISVVKLWINLLSKCKCEKPDYISLQPNEVPKLKLEDGAGWIKILLGAYQGTASKLRSGSREILFHIHLEAGRQFAVATDPAIEYAAFLPSYQAVINDVPFQSGRLVAFTFQGEIIQINNTGSSPNDIILFGGEPYSEPIVVDGTFVMNTPHEITQAYNDFYDGKFGQLKTHNTNHS